MITEESLKIIDWKKFTDADVKQLADNINSIIRSQAIAYKNYCDNHPFQSVIKTDEKLYDEFILWQKKQQEGKGK